MARAGVSGRSRVVAVGLTVGLALGCGSALTPWEPPDDGQPSYEDPDTFDARVVERDARVPDARVNDARVDDARGDVADADDDASEPEAGDAGPHKREEETADCPLHPEGTIVRARTLETPGPLSGSGGGPVGLKECGDGTCLLVGATAAGSTAQQAASQLLKLDIQGHELWRQPFAPTTNTARFHALDLAAAADGSTAIAGACRGQVALPHRNGDTALLSCAADEAELVLLHLRAEGTVDWFHKFSGSGVYPHAMQVAMTPDGRVFTAGSLWNSGTGHHTSVVSLSADGAVLYQRDVRGSEATPSALEVYDDGSLVIAGAFAGSPIELADVAADASVPVSQAAPGNCMISLDPAGALAWVRCFADELMLLPRMARDADGSLVIASTFNGRLDLGGPVIGGDAGALYAPGNYDVCLARYGRDGSPQWQRQLGNVDHQSLSMGLTTTPDHDIYLGLNTNTPFSPAESLPALEGSRLFALGFDASGAARWSAPFGEADSMYGSETMMRDQCGNLRFASVYKGWLYATTGEVDRPEGLVLGSISLPAP